MESMTNAPYLLPQARSGYRMGNGALVDSMVNDGLWEAYRGFHMGVGAEMIAAKYGISRDEQDAFAVESHRRAAAATAEGHFRDEILPVEIPGSKKGEKHRVFETDEAIRAETSLDILARLKPAFQDGGTVTAGNAPGVSDGAAAVVVTSAERARERGLRPLAVIRAQATAGREPEWFGLAPIDAVRKVAAKAGWGLDSVDLFELNEAFAVQALAVNRELGLDPGPSQYPWRFGSSWTSHRSQRRPGAGDPAARDGTAPEEPRHRRSLPGRRQCRRAGGGARLTDASAPIQPRVTVRYRTTPAASGQ